VKLKKIIELRLSPQDVLSMTYVRLYQLMSGLIGTMLFKIKATAFGVKFGQGSRCYGPVHILRHPKSEMVIGNNVTIVSSTKRCTASSIFAPAKMRTLSGTAKIIIEDNVGLNGTSISARSKTVRIGKGTMIAPNVTITDSDFHRIWPPENRAISPGFENDADVIIGKNVWIGMQAIILKGVHIGDNSVIAAGSVVTRDIDADMLAGGIPTKKIRKLL